MSIESIASNIPFATSSPRVMPPKMLKKMPFTPVEQNRVNRRRHGFGFGAAADVQEVRRASALALHNVERRHHQTGAVADDADVAVQRT